MASLDSVRAVVEQILAIERRLGGTQVVDPADLERAISGARIGRCRGGHDMLRVSTWRVDRLTA